jgi:hypothetical protein
VDRSLVSFSEVIPFEFHFCFARSEAAKRIDSTYAMQEGRRCVDSSIHRVEPNAIHKRIPQNRATSNYGQDDN